MIVVIKCKREDRKEGYESKIAISDVSRVSRKVKKTETVTDGWTVVDYTTIFEIYYNEESESSYEKFKFNDYCIFEVLPE